MKFYFNLFLLALFFFTKSYSQTAWIKTFKDSSCSNCAIEINNEYLSVGWAIINSNKDFFILKTKTDGSEIWSKNFGGQSDDYLTHCIYTDDNYIVAGVTTSFGSGQQDIYLAKINKSGDIIWDTTYGGPLDEQCCGLLQADDGGYIIGGWTKSFGAGNEDFYVIKTDLEGNYLWSKTYGGSAREYIYGNRCIQQTTDKGLILSCYTASKIIGKSLVWLIKTNLYGDTIWTKTYTEVPEPPISGNTNPQTQIIQTNNEYIIACSKILSNYHQVHLIRTDSIGTLKWENTIKSTHDAPDNVSDICLTKDNGFVITGYSDGWSNDPSEILFQKFDSTGSVLWTKNFYSGSGWLSGSSIRQTSDFGFLITGSWNIKGTEKFAIFKTTSKGDTSNNLIAPDLISPKNESVEIIQNPIFNWNYSFGASSYNLQITESNFINPLIDSNITKTSINISGLNNNTVYYWRVNALNDIDTSTWSEVWHFTTSATSILPISTSYSNNTLKYVISRPCLITVQYYDLKGKIIVSFKERIYKTGNYRVKIPSSLSTGIYLQKFKAGEYFKINQISVIK